MAAGTLPSPGKLVDMPGTRDHGKEIGPCVGTCEHRDCAATRRQAESACVKCGKPIGYETPFFRAGCDPEPLVHSDCLED